MALWASLKGFGLSCYLYFWGSGSSKMIVFWALDLVAFPFSSAILQAAPRQIALMKIARFRAWGVG